MGSPVSAISMATFRGRARGRRNSPPPAATRERFTSGKPKRAVVEATMRSAARASSQPPARAGPSAATITGLVRSRCTKPPKPPLPVVSSAAWPALMALRSAPAQKTSPAWVRIPIHRASSSSSRSMAASIPRATAPLMAFLASGRLSVMVATWPSTLTSIMRASYRPSPHPQRWPCRTSESCCGTWRVLRRQPARRLRRARRSARGPRRRPVRRRRA